MSKFKVILSDLDGVLRNYPVEHSAEIEEALGLEAGGLLPIAFQRKLLEPAITGMSTDEEWRKQIAEELTKFFDKEKVTAAIKKWSTFPGQLDEKVYEFYKAKKEKYKIALLTNATTKLNSDLRTLGIFDLFDYIYNTSEIGYAKPDPRAFHHVLNTISYPAHEILFIDDRDENIKMASSLGFRVHLFKGHTALKEIMD